MLIFEPVTKVDSVSAKWQGSTKNVAVLILAGGQGSRLHASSPKALIPLTEHQTLLEWQLQKVGSHPCVVITSPGNHDQIAESLHTTTFRPTLITQTEVPFLTDEGEPFSAGPDGNGHALHLLKQHGMLERWKKAGIETITVMPIDNVLAQPLDPRWIGYHLAQKADVTAIAIEKTSPSEKVGLFVYDRGKTIVREYSECAEGQEGKLASTGLFAFSLSFAERVIEYELPWHVAHKQDPVSGRWGWKSERFLFDVLQWADKTVLLLYAREEIFAPIKDLVDLERAKKLLKDRG